MEGGVLIMGEAVKGGGGDCGSCCLRSQEQRGLNRATFTKHRHHPRLRQCAGAGAGAGAGATGESLGGEASRQPLPLPNNRRLVLLRHAQSSWADRSLKDHDRPLNEHGRKAAANIASKLQRASWLPEIILCSDSTRTKETLDIMQNCVHQLQEVEVYFIGSFYSVAAMDGQTAQHLQQIICKYSTNVINTVMCMGHNKGWEEAASKFSGTSVELNTANAALLEAYGRSWEEAFEHAGEGGWKLVSVIRPD